MAYDALDGSTHDNKTFNLYTEKMILYSSMTILLTNRKIKKITHTAFFCMMAYDALDGSIHDYSKDNVTQREDDVIRVCRRFLHDSLSPLMVISLVFLELVEQIELALSTYVTFQLNPASILLAGFLVLLPVGLCPKGFTTVSKWTYPFLSSPFWLKDPQMLFQAFCCTALGCTPFHFTWYFSICMSSFVHVQPCFTHKTSVTFLAQEIIYVFVELFHMAHEFECVTWSNLHLGQTETSSPNSSGRISFSASYTLPPFFLVVGSPGSLLTFAPLPPCGGEEDQGGLHLHQYLMTTEVT